MSTHIQNSIWKLLQIYKQLEQYVPNVHRLQSPWKMKQ